jgi:hypothetical protein
MGRAAIKINTRRAAQNRITVPARARLAPLVITAGLGVPVNQQALYYFHALRKLRDRLDRRRRSTDPVEVVKAAIDDVDRVLARGPTPREVPAPRNSSKPAEPPAPRALTDPRLIVDVTCTESGVEQDVLASREVISEIVVVRHACFLVLALRTDLTRREIGALFGRDHTAVTYVLSNKRNDARVLELVQRIEARLDSMLAGKEAPCLQPA